MRDAYASANPAYQLKLRVVNELAWHNLFQPVRLQPAFAPRRRRRYQLGARFQHQLRPRFPGRPGRGRHSPNQFAILNFTKKLVLIGGTAYAGEMKEGIFGVLNYLLPHERQTLPMHCPANVGAAGDPAIRNMLTTPAPISWPAPPRWLPGRPPSPAYPRGRVSVACLLLLLLLPIALLKGSAERAFTYPGRPI